MSLYNRRREPTFLDLVAPPRRHTWRYVFIIFTCFFLAAGGVGAYFYQQHKSAVVAVDTTIVGVPTPTPAPTPTPTPIIIEVRRAEPITPSPTPSPSPSPSPVHKKQRPHRSHQTD